MSGAVGGLAGCGYRPGGGDLAWESSIGPDGLHRTGPPRFAVTSDRLFAVRNQSGLTYDFGTSTWQDVENASVTAVDESGETRLAAETERQAVAPPAVTEELLFVPVEGGRITAIDRGTAGIDPNARRTTGGTSGDGAESDEAEGDDVRWQVDGIATADDGTADSPGIDGVRASGRLAVAIAGPELIALDAETGDRAFQVPEAWPDRAGASDRVAVDGGNVWAAIVSESDGRSGGESEGATPVLTRFGPSGERRAERPVSVDISWLVRVGETLVAGSAAAGTVIGFDPNLDRRFSLSVPAPRDRPPVVEGDREKGSARQRLYLRRGGTVRALDVGDGDTAWKRTDLPAHQRVAVDSNGVYAVGSRAILAVGVDGEDRWRAPLPEGVTVDELFAVGGRLVAFDDGELYGFHATPGERWSLIG